LLRLILLRKILAHKSATFQDTQNHCHQLRRTKIHTTKKLEKLVKKLITTGQNTDCGILGKWNATVFYVDRKKCWLITNGLTKYNIILTDIKSSDLSKIEQIFKDALFGQLIYDGIIMDFENLNSIIGGLDFLPTDNDRSTTGFQNQRLGELDWWKHEFESLENMPIKDLTNRMNTSPIRIGKGSKMSDYTDSIEEMKKILSE
tara:strand:- start:1159 stop:1767 length:609 start_codon:yes stop_codon:yes gene_type:complete